jgi:imidazolonepropionase-like amidohydrolase
MPPIPTPRIIPFLLFAVAGISAVEAAAQDSPVAPPNAILIRGASVFTGCSPDLLQGQDVFVAGNLISRIGPDLDPPDFATIIEADGHVLIPGLIDAHWHSVFAEATIPQLFTTNEGYWNLLAARAQRAVLYRGFTTVRDTGGPMFDIARATDEGLIEGPRVFASGPGISQTAGHQDFRLTRDVPATPDRLHSFETSDMFYLADGVPQVLLRVRENLMQGATQIKLMAGGGVTSSYDPIHTIQFTRAELAAAVEAAENWGTYVLTHAINDEAVNHSIDAGVKSIEHGHMSTRETLQRFVEEDVWLSMQPFLEDEDAPALDAFQQAKYRFVTEGTDFVYRTAKELGIKIAFGTDTLFSADLAKRQGAQLAKLQTWFTPFEALKMATCDNAELLKLSGDLTPYPLGPLGVIEEGAYADLILVDGNPLETLDLVSDPDANFDLIMKDGVIYKNTLD